MQPQSRSHLRGNAPRGVSIPAAKRKMVVTEEHKEMVGMKVSVPMEREAAARTGGHRSGRLSLHYGRRKYPVLPVKSVSKPLSPEVCVLR